MAYSFQTTVADGSTNIFSVGFPYISKNYVKVYKDGVLVDPATLTWPSAGQVQLPDSAGSLTGKTILRQRESPLDAALATFLAGPFDHNALNSVLTQMLHLAVEARDGYSGASLTWRGAHSSTYSYAVNDVVTYSGSSYRSIVSANLAVTPGTDSSKWQLIASKGDMGTTAWGDLTGVPGTFPPSAHSQAISTITGLQATLDAKLPLAGGTMTGVTLYPAGTVTLPSLAAVGDANTGIYFPGADSIALTTGGVQRLVADASGNIGIGGAATAKLDVFGSLVTRGSITLYADSNGSFIFGRHSSGSPYSVVNCPSGSTGISLQFNGAQVAYLSSGGMFTATGGLVAGSAMASTWSVDNSTPSTSIASGAEVAFPAGSGLLVLSEDTTGNVGVFAVGGGAVYYLGGTGTAWAATSTPSASQIGVYYSGTYRVKNGFAASRTVRCLSNRVRNSS